MSALSLVGYWENAFTSADLSREKKDFKALRLPNWSSSCRGITRSNSIPRKTS